MKFTNSPYETMMQQVPRYERPEPVKAPEGSRCHGCPYWRGMCPSCSMTQPLTEAQSQSASR